MTKNYAINLSNQLISMFLGLLITSLLSKNLGVETYGIYSFIITVSSFCLIFSIFGITNYGPKSISQSKNINRTFSEIFSFQLVNTFLILLLLFLGIILFHESINTKVWFIMLFYLTGLSLDCNWFFIGTQKLKYSFLLKVPFQFTNLILIFLFVTESTQLLLLLIIISCSAMLSMSLSLFFVFKKVKFTFKISNFKKLLPILFQFFLPILIISLYTVVDKILLGIISDPSQLAYFTNSVTIVKMLTVITSSANAIIMPNIASNIDNPDYVKRLLNNVIKFSTVISLLLISLLIVLSTNIVLILFGSDYIGMVNIIILLSPIIYLISLGNIISLQYFTAAGLNKKFASITLVGGILNLCINLILIPKYGALGAAFATLFAEIVVTIIGIIYIRKIVTLSKLFFSLLKCIIPTITSIYVCSLFYFESNILSLCIKSTIVILIFVICIIINDILLKDKIILNIIQERRSKNEKNTSC